jgi:hypothetical protein
MTGLMRQCLSVDDFETPPADPSPGRGLTDFLLLQSVIAGELLDIKHATEEIIHNLSGD